MKESKKKVAVKNNGKKEIIKDAEAIVQKNVAQNQTDIRVKIDSKF